MNKLLNVLDYRNAQSKMKSINLRYANEIETCMTVALIVYLITINFSKLAIYYEYSDMFWFEKILRYSCYLFWFLLILNNIVKRKMQIFNVALLLTGCAILFCTRERVIILLLLLLIAYSEYDVKKMIKINMIISITILILVVGLSIVGVFPNWAFERTSTEFRYSFGYAYTTYLPSDLLAILISLIYLYKEKIKYIFIAGLFIANLLAFHYTDTRASFILSSLLLLYIFLKKIGKKEIDKIKCNTLIIDKCKYVFLFAPMFILLLTLLTAIMFGNSNKFAVALNRILSGRLYYSYQALMEYDIKLFGNKIEWIGYGSVNYLSEVTREYNFVDNSYLRSLLDQGVIFTIIILLMFGWILYNKRRSLTESIVVLAVLAWLFIEPQMLKIDRNILLILLIPYCIKGNIIDDKIKNIYLKYKKRNKL